MIIIIISITVLLYRLRSISTVITYLLKNITFIWENQFGSEHWPALIIELNLEKINFTMKVVL